MQKLRLKLKANESIHSLNNILIKLHGYTMDLIDKEYADLLHQQSVNPYSMNLFVDKDKNYVWEVNCLTEESFEKLGKPILLLLQKEVELKGKKEFALQVEAIETSSLTQKDLSDSFYRSDPQNFLHIQFHTPTAFKQNKSYIFYPDLRLIFQSLMMKWQYFELGDNEIDQDMLDNMLENISIQNYDLKSTYYSIHKVKISAFIGRITIKVTGSDTLKNYVRALLEFGEYSGVGIKTSLGMGSISLLRK